MNESHVDFSGCSSVRDRIRHMEQTLHLHSPSSPVSPPPVSRDPHVVLDPHVVRSSCKQKSILVSDSPDPSYLPMMYLLPDQPPCPRDSRDSSVVLILDDTLEDLRSWEISEGSDPEVWTADSLLVNLDTLSSPLKEEQDFWCMVDHIPSSTTYHAPTTELCMLHDSEGDDFQLIKKKEIHTLMTQDIEQYASTRYKKWCSSIPFSMLNTYKGNRSVETVIDTSISQLSRTVWIDKYPWIQTALMGYHGVVYIKGLWTLYSLLQTIHSVPIPFTPSIPSSSSTSSSYLVFVTQNLPALISIITTLSGLLL